MEYSNATYDDIPEIVALGSLNHEESRFRDIPYDNRTCVQNAIMRLQTPEDSFMMVAKHEGEIVGYLIGGKFPYIFNNNAYYAADELIYVDPAFRGKLVAKRLISYFTDWARRNGCSEVAIGTITEIATERTKKLYERVGLKEVGSLFRNLL
jgi:GNAT superfamily N-acetyltransferase